MERGDPTGPESEAERLRPDDVAEIFQRVLELDPEARAQVLGSVDAAVAAEVRSLVASHDAAESFLETSAGRLLSGDEPEVALEAGTRVGAYVIERKIGEGGGGGVYVALQEHPRRRVAVKVMQSVFATERHAQRFVEECEILAGLQHAGIAHVYDAGTVHVRGNDVPYFAMELIEGSRDLVTYADEESLSLRDRIDLVGQTADAVHHGHANGVIHRDLKPGNVLVGADGRVRVIDFGLARFVDPETGAGHRRTFTVSGTLPYMSPEQCDPANRTVDVRSDVYALGVVLYRLIAGRLPHDVGGVSTREAIDRIRHDIAPPPSTFDRSLRGDLDAIVGRAMARAPSERYASAAALADDLRRYLDHLPVEARHGGPLYHAQRLARRNPVAALAATGAFVLAVAAAIVSTRLAIENDRARGEAEYRSYVASIAAAAAALRTNDTVEVRNRLDSAPEDHRGWEWHYLQHACDSSVGSFGLVGRQLIAAEVANDGTALTLSKRLENLEAACVLTAWRPLGVLAYETTLAPDRNGPYCIAVSPDSATIAVGYRDGTVELREALDGSLRSSFRPHDSMINALAFHPSGRLLATGSRDSLVREWHIESLELDVEYRADVGRAAALAYAPDGSRLAIGGRNGVIRVCRRGEPLVGLEGHVGSVEAVAFLPDGRRLLSAGRDRTVRLWDVESGEFLRAHVAHEGVVRDLAIAHDGQTFASASWDRSVIVWDTDDLRPRLLGRGHGVHVASVARLPETGRFVSFGEDGSARVWDGDAVPEELRRHRDRVTAVAFSADGERLASASADHDIRLWDPSTGQCLDTVATDVRPIQRLSFRDDERTPRYWMGWQEEAMYPSEPELRAKIPRGGVWIIDEPEKRVLARSLDFRRLSVFDAADGSLIRVITPHKTHVIQLTISPQDGRLATLGSDDEVRLWTADCSRRLASRRLPHPQHRCAAFSSDGSLLTLGSTDGTILLVDGHSLEVVRLLEGHAAQVHALTFSPDGARLASGSTDTTVRIWDVRTGECVLVLDRHEHPVFTLAWSPDGHKLAAGGGAWESDESTLFLFDGSPESDR